METNFLTLQRREILALFAASTVTIVGVPASAAGAQRKSLVAAWQRQNEQHIGLLSVDRGYWKTQRSIIVPTRAHGLCSELDGSVLAVARRPGDWLLRWQPRSGKKQWHWMGGDRRLNGHVIASGDGRKLWTTETDLDTAMGRLGVRDARSLEKTNEWATHGMDPHAILVLPRAVGNIPAGTLMVANGGIPTLPETGRAKFNISRMDSSLVAIHPNTGELLGQWRLEDTFLSIRHLAWDHSSQTLGLALQAEHSEAAQRKAAPVLAVWRGQALMLATGQASMMGYGGDICAIDAGGFAVSCPRANTVAIFSADASFISGVAHDGCCALAANANNSTSATKAYWVGGTAGILQADFRNRKAAEVNLDSSSDTSSDSRFVPEIPLNSSVILFDNHWHQTNSI